ncbi:hypothetical protein Dimus_018002 [Dionaea muscipula]
MAYAGASSSMASSATASLLLCILACKSTIRCLSMPHLPQPRVSTSSFSVDSWNFSDETSNDAGELLTELKEKVRIKSCGMLLRISPRFLSSYGGGAILAIWVSSIGDHALATSRDGVVGRLYRSGLRRWRSCSHVRLYGGVACGRQQCCYVCMYILYVLVNIPCYVCMYTLYVL